MHVPSLNKPQPNQGEPWVCHMLLVCMCQEYNCYAEDQNVTSRGHVYPLDALCKLGILLPGGPSRWRPCAAAVTPCSADCCCCSCCCPSYCGSTGAAPSVVATVGTLQRGPGDLIPRERSMQRCPVRLDLWPVWAVHTRATCCSKCSESMQQHWCLSHCICGMPTVTA